MGNPVLETLRRLETHIREQNLDRSAILNPRDLAAKSALPEHTVRCLLRGKNPPADTVNDRVQARIKALSDAHLARSGKPMSDLAGNVSRKLGISGVWARQVCSGEKTPSVELLHGLVEFFGVQGKEAFFTAPAPEALNRVLLGILAEQQPTSEPSVPGPDSLTPAEDSFDDVRSVRLRQARDLPPERWKVLNATLTALLQFDDSQGDR
ncbi:hypothetical protein [Streptomyces lanatus]|uniref:XRE family transcriptional regulator n=1 Tax=Streptomyces lanatus TaxID=66900 RepID=A0ABV1Y023_9ACTN|nr:hypothetical protein [Streptomyces lanatus]